MLSSVFWSYTSAHSSGVRTEWLIRRQSPELLEESGDGVLALDGLLRGAEQQQQVHVGIGEHLAAAVAPTATSAGPSVGTRETGSRPRRRNGSIDVRRTFGQSGARVASVEKLGRRGTEREAKVRFPHDRRCGCV